MEMEPGSEEAEVVEVLSKKIDILDSDSEDEDGFPGTDEITEEEKKRMGSDAGKLKFAKVIRERTRYSKEIKWTTLNDELPKDKDLDMVDDLMQLDLKRLMDHLQAVNKNRNNWFWVPSLNGKQFKMSTWCTKFPKLFGEDQLSCQSNCY